MRIEESINGIAAYKMQSAIMKFIKDLDALDESVQGLQTMAEIMRDAIWMNKAKLGENCLQIFMKRFKEIR